jgi:RNA polymerase sigma-70 factor, ECF subfamily
MHELVRYPVAGPMTSEPLPKGSMDSIHRLIEQTFRQEAGRVLAALLNTVSDFELAEDALQDALLLALERWPKDGVPRNPAAWITTAARHKAIDRLRREHTLARKQVLLQALVKLEQGESAAMTDATFPDERLKLIFTCCHPALAMEAQVALTLHTLGGVSTVQIAHAFLVPVPTMSKRLGRARRKIKEAGIPYRVPPTPLFAERLTAVFAVLYLIFNEGYTASSGASLIHQELCDEAIRLGRLVITLLANEPSVGEDAEALGLLALMLFHNSRRTARLGAEGELLTLEEQDRSHWDHQEIKEGIALLDRALWLNRPGPYQIQAAIAALHAQAERPEQTDWPQIALLYGALMRMAPSPIVALNHAVAIAMVEGPSRGLNLLQALEISPILTDYYLFSAARADLFRRTGQVDEARRAYTKALELCQNETELSFLRRRLSQLASETEKQTTREDL